MEFFTRLLRRDNTEPRAISASTPQSRLASFKAVYSRLLQLWRNGAAPSRDAFVPENVRVCVARLSALLTADLRGPTPHLCVSFAFTNGVSRTLTQIGAAFKEPGIASEVLGVLLAIVDNEEEAFLEDRGLADALPGFAEVVSRDLKLFDGDEHGAWVEGPEGSENTLEARMVEVLFGVANAIRLKPLVLKAWFRPEQVFEDMDELEDDELPQRHDEFPLFYLIMSYVPAPGRIGDFARMGLLYIVESTTYSSKLERWLVEGDMAALMASILGAVYSQLSTKLALTYREGSEPAIIRYATKREEPPGDVVGTSATEYQTRLSTFFSSLRFWQDVLDHCPSHNVKQTLLDHFQFLFLQQLLYPSLLGSSDVDGGSSVAVLTYLRNILESITHPELVHRILVYLFGLPPEKEPLDISISPVAKARRRKSEHLLARNIDDDEKPSPELFNLGDLINNGLRSRGQQTVVVTLRLLSTLLRRQHQEALPSLLKIRPIRETDTTRTYGGHQKEIDAWITLAENLASSHDVERSFERAIYDNRNAIELHVCTTQILHISLPDMKLQGPTKSLQPYVLLPEDPICKSLLALLDQFLINDIETNLSLTQVYLDLTSCGFLRLEGWLLTLPAKYVYKNDRYRKSPNTVQDNGSAETSETAVEDEPESSERDPMPSHARDEPAWHADDCSPIYKSIDSLLARIESFHRELQDFDVLLAECKKEVSKTLPREPQQSTGTTFIATPSASTSMSRDNSRHLAAPTASSVRASSRDSNLSTSSRSVAASHKRSGSIADRVASVFGSSPRKGEFNTTAPNLLAPLHASRLMMRLSEASNPAPAGSRATGAEPSSLRSSPRKTEGMAPDGRIPGHTRDQSSSSQQTPTQPSHARHKSLRGEDFGASPSPRLDRKVVPGATRRNTQSSMKQAIGSDSDDSDDSDDDEDIRGSVSGSDEDGQGKNTPSGQEDSAEKSEDEDETIMIGRKIEAKKGDITVGHLLTNVIILQEFVLELAAVVDVRGTMFDEVRFD